LIPLPRLSVVVLLLLGPVAYAVAEDDACLVRPDSLATTAAAATPTKDAPLDVYARSVRSRKDGTAELDGDVELKQGENRVHAEHMEYGTQNRTASATGNVVFRNAFGDTFQTESLRLNLDTREGEAGAAQYRLRNDLARGDAARIEFRGPNDTRLSELRYTTCRPGQDDWFLTIGQLDLDTEEDIGTATHTTVHFLGVPLFYFPYVSFPISDRRKSGFLFPGIGHSDKLGYELEAPYYFNLAPNYDATVNPHLFSRRGVQLENELRYLTASSNGDIRYDILPHDKVTGDDRAAGSLRHHHTLNPWWSGNLNLNSISDNEYFTDFGDHLNITTQTHLTRSADLTYRGSHWSFAARLNDYQTIDSTIAEEFTPYTRLPQISLARTALPISNKVNLLFDAEWNRFEHDPLSTNERLIEGSRFTLNTGISLPLENSWGFITPKLGVRTINYSLTLSDLTPEVTDESAHVSSSVFSLDTGLILERDSVWGGRDMTQTLEPRLFYLRIPEKRQSGLPNFDTSLPDFSLAALFRENRFIGGDRIGDANQITGALSTRFIDDENGVERLRLSLGRIYYFSEPEVSADPGPPVDAPTISASDIVGEANFWLTGNWHMRHTVQWNTRTDELERSSLYLQYQPTENRIFNLGQVFERDRVEQVDMSFEWPLASHWSMRARSLYSTLDERNIESYAGLEYNSCCWALRMFGSRRWQGGEQVNAVMVQLELTGLSKLGQASASPLEQGLFFPYRD
jgi:LPS-assembly protein